MIITNVTIMPGTQLYQQRENGEFVESTEKERLLEICELIAQLKIQSWLIVKHLAVRFFCCPSSKRKDFINGSFG